MMQITVKETLLNKLLVSEIFWIRMPSGSSLSKELAPFVDLLHDSDERMAVIFVQPLVSLKSPEVNRTKKFLSQNLIFSVVNRT